MNRQDAKAPREDAPDPALDAVAREVVDAAFAVHRELGPGLLESVYERCLAHELDLRQVPVRRQVAVPVRYRGLHLDNGLRIDLVAGGCVVIEIKAVETLQPVHEAQLLT